MAEYIVSFEHEEYTNANDEEEAIKNFRINNGLTLEEHEKKITIKKIRE